MAISELDSVLTLVEDASERGETRVSTELARYVGARVPGFRAGVPISDALDAVFQEQEAMQRRRSTRSALDPSLESSDGNRALLRHHSSSAGAIPPDSAEGLLTAGEARALTRRIKLQVRQTCLLLDEAHRRRAWIALGYGTWNEYVFKEFGYSRTRAYEILDQARVIQTLQEAAGGRATVDISPYTARRLKPCVQDVALAINRELEANTDTEPNGVVRMVVARALEGLTEASPGRSLIKSGVESLGFNRGVSLVPTSTQLSDSSVDWRAIFSFVDYLAGLPVLSSGSRSGVRVESRNLAALRLAIKWLSGLADQLEANA